MDKCPICRQPIKEEQRQQATRGSFFDISCSSCGNYQIGGFFESVLSKDIAEDKRCILSGILREASDQDRPIKLLEGNLNDVLASASPPDGPIEAMDRILLYVKDQGDTVADFVEIQSKDYPIAYAKNPKEFVYYLTNLIQLGLLNNSGSSYQLTLNGWKHLMDLSKDRIDSSQAFVAMWFNEKTAEAWEEGFYKALKETGYNPIRIDLVQHNDKIDDRIIAEIRRSGLLIADFTGSRGGVYFESGFAMGLGIPVIWTCRKDWIEKLHFDTRQYNHIEWESTIELKDKLVARIEATLPMRTRRHFR